MLVLFTIEVEHRVIAFGAVKLNGAGAVMSTSELMRLYWQAMERSRIAAFGFIVPEPSRRRRKPSAKFFPSKRRPFKKRRRQKARR